MYRALTGWPWSPAKGSRASSVSMASQIAAQDFLRERALAARERHLPQGPIVVFSGPAIWSDWEPLWARLDQIKRSEEHTSELQSLMRISYAVFCLKKKKNIKTTDN